MLTRDCPTCGRIGLMHWHLGWLINPTTQQIEHPAIFHCGPGYCGREWSALHRGWYMQDMKINDVIDLDWCIGRARHRASDEMLWRLESLGDEVIARNARFG